ncbi:MAG: epimerase [Cognatishimia sp.]|uniref:NAD-dependent epimerase/dehydratase family protein n=1 Tax=Cognatishimia sp. TaxID=2211648 RepID=UPI003B8B2BB2
MRCLVVGGTGFLGGAITDGLLAAGHDVSILSRGETRRSIPGEAITIQADRYGVLDHLRQHRFEWVFDTCAYTPKAVENLLLALGDQVQRYVMISSISAYGAFAKARLDETENVPTATEDDLAFARALPAKDRASAAAYGVAYGRLKRSCEITAQDILGTGATSLRVGLLIGAGDYSDRLTAWVRRIDLAQGELCQIPAPRPENARVQLIDVRDVADFALLCCKGELHGVWNVTSEATSMAEVLSTIHQVTRSDAHFVWVDPQTITKTGLRPWVDVPLMIPDASEFTHFMNVSTDKARAAGLKNRPLTKTLTPLLKWDRGRRNIALKAGITPAQENMLLS